MKILQSLGTLAGGNNLVFLGNDVVHGALDVFGQFLDGSGQLQGVVLAQIAGALDSSDATVDR